MSTKTAKTKSKPKTAAKTAKSAKPRATAGADGKPSAKKPAKTARTKTATAKSAKAASGKPAKKAAAGTAKSKSKTATPSVKKTKVTKTTKKSAASGAASAKKDAKKSAPKKAAAKKPASKATSKSTAKPAAKLTGDKIAASKSPAKAAAAKTPAAKPKAESTKPAPKSKATAKAKPEAKPAPKPQAKAKTKTAPDAAAKLKAVMEKTAAAKAAKEAKAAKDTKAAATKAEKPKEQPVIRMAEPPFKAKEFIVYPSHGVGQILDIEVQEVAGHKLELFVVNFDKDKMTLRVPTHKAESVGMRKLSSPDLVAKAINTLKGRARVKRTMWSRRAQEYEAKINSGDLISIAEVVRDLFRSDRQPEQSYSERQLYEAALDRMAREVAAVESLSEADAIAKIEGALQKSSSRSEKAEADESEAA